jgi:hypothetical protein
LLEPLDGCIQDIKSLIQGYILNFVKPNRCSFEEDRSILKRTAECTVPHMSYILGSYNIVAGCSPIDMGAVGTVVCISCKGEVVLLDFQPSIEPIHEYFEVAAIIGVL